MPKISPGTLCILRGCTNPDNNGKTVTAIRRYLMTVNYPGNKQDTVYVWEVDTALISWNNSVVDFAPETQLVPITPPDLDGFLLDEIIKEACNA